MEPEKSIIELPKSEYSKREDSGLEVVPTAQATPMSMLDIAVRRGMDVATIKDLMALQREWEANEARKAFNVAFANFKAEAINAIKNKMVTDGPLKGKSYAELFSVVNAVTPALSSHGLSHSWKLTRDEKDWIEVTCTLRHVLGHFESVSMGGLPDTGGAKSAMQARASAVTYLERYTLKAICGVSEQGDDDDGGKGGKKEVETLSEEKAATIETLATEVGGTIKAILEWIKKHGRGDFEKLSQVPDALYPVIIANLEKKRAK